MVNTKRYSYLLIIRFGDKANINVYLVL